MKISFNNPDYYKCDIKHLKSKKVLDFKNKKIIPNRGVYSFGEFELDYDEEKSQTFDSWGRNEGKNEIKKKYMMLSLSKYIGNNFSGPILSVGCGTMYWDSKLAINNEIIPTDISNYMLEVSVAKNRSKFGIQADASRLPFSDSQFELTYSIDGIPAAYSRNDIFDEEELLFYSRLRKKIFREMSRVTKSGGEIWLILPNRRQKDFLNIPKKIFNKDYDRYGFDLPLIKEEINSVGLQIKDIVYEMNITPFKSKTLNDIWFSLIKFFGISFLGKMCIKISKLD